EAVAAREDAAPDPEAAAAIDLEAELVRAIRGFHDAHAAAGGEDDLALVYAFSGRTVDGLGEAEIAAREGKSRDQVKRLLARARDEIVSRLAGAVLERDGAPSSDAERARLA